MNFWPFFIVSLVDVDVLNSWPPFGLSPFFNLVIRLSKVNCWPFFMVSLVDVDVLNNWPLFGHSPFSFLHEVEQATGHAFQVWSLSFGFLGEVQLCT